MNKYSSSVYIPFIILILMSLISCSDEFEYSEKKWKSEYPKSSKCGVEYLGLTFFDDAGISIYSSALDKTNFLCYINSLDIPLILSKESEQFNLKSLNFSSIDVKDSTIVGGFHNSLFCPYDNNIVIGFVVMSNISGQDKFGENIYHFSQVLCKYNIKTQKFVIVPLNLSNDEYEMISENGLVHWVKQSTPNNDYILTKNHKRLHLQSGKLLEGYSNKTNDIFAMLVAVSPDESKYVSLNPNNKNGDFYVNDRKHSNKVLFNIFRNNSFQKVNWSDDAKSFSTKYDYLDDTNYNFYSVSDGNSINLTSTIDILSLHCSLYANGTPFFYSDSSYIVTLYPNLSRRGELYEVNKKGEIIRQITKFF